MDRQTGVADVSHVWPADLPAQWPHRAASCRVHAGGLAWHVQIFGAVGAHPDVVLLHGAGASAHSWRALAPLLAVDRRVIVPDLPGQGWTQRPPNAGGLSLPGMTMGARKRALRAIRATGATEAWIADLRPHWRIGERLRLCPGDKHIPYRWASRKRWIDANDCHICKGEGVVRTPLDRSGPTCPGCCNCATRVCKRRDPDDLCAEQYMHCDGEGVLQEKAVLS